MWWTHVLFQSHPSFFLSPPLNHSDKSSPLRLEIMNGGPDCYFLFTARLMGKVRLAFKYTFRIHPECNPFTSCRNYCSGPRRCPAPPGLGQWTPRRPHGCRDPPDRACLMKPKSEAIPLLGIPQWLARCVLLGNRLILSIA